MRRWTLATLIALLALPAHAQRTVAYDTVSDGFPAAVTCGFCAGEKFGVVFYELPGGTGLRADEFPLTLTAIQIAVARIRVTGSALGGGYTCAGSNMEGTVDLTLDVFAGETVPTSIRNLPASGAWPGETMVLTTEATATVSVATADGGSEFNVTLNEIPIPEGGVLVEAPATYLRVVASIPGGGSSASCTELGFTSPGAVAIRDDDGRVAPRRSLLYALPVDLGGLGIPGGWYWNEEVPSDDGGPPGVAGDWALRISVSPSSAPPVDAGPTPPRDAGTLDGGPIATEDAGTSSDASTPFDGGTSSCTMDSQCGGGERCVDGACVRTTCTTTDECGGGRSCVDGRCRNLCDTDRECEGGEVCDATEGVCRPADSGGGDGGGCSCRAPGSESSSSLPLVSLALGLAWLTRRRRL